MDQREEYNRQLQEIISTKGRNNVYMTKATYAQMLRDVQNAKLKQHFKTPVDYRRLQRYDIMTVGNENKLISPVANWNDPKIQYFVTMEELFDVIHEAHLNNGHAGRNLLVKELNLKYRNVTTESVMLYLNLCKACQDKSRRKRTLIDKSEFNQNQETSKRVKEIISTPVEAKEFNSQCHINIVNMLTHPDCEYRFFLIYVDQRTKFIILRPLKTKTPTDIADNLLDIFMLIGTPISLQTDNVELTKRIIAELTNQWHEIKLVPSNPNQLQVQSMESTSEDVQNMLCTWLSDNKSTKWSHGLKFVQMMKNSAYHDGLKHSPYEAMFGINTKDRMINSNLTNSAIINSEDNLSGTVSAPKFNVQLDKHLPDLTNVTTDIFKPSSSERVSVQITSSTEEATSTTENSVDNQRLNTEVKDENDSIDFEEFNEPIYGVSDVKVDPLSNVKSESAYKECSVELENEGIQGAKASSVSSSDFFSGAKLSIMELVQRPKGGKCNCRTKCETKKCRCKAGRVSCTPNCHFSTECSNNN